MMVMSSFEYVLCSWSFEVFDIYFDVLGRSAPPPTTEAALFLSPPPLSLSPSLTSNGLPWPRAAMWLPCAD